MGLKKHRQICPRQSSRLYPFFLPAYQYRQRLYILFDFNYFCFLVDRCIIVVWYRAILSHRFLCKFAFSFSINSSRFRNTSYGRSVVWKRIVNRKNDSASTFIDCATPVKIQRPVRLIVWTQSSYYVSFSLTMMTTCASLLLGAVQPRHSIGTTRRKWGLVGGWLYLIRACVSNVQMEASLGGQRSVKQAIRGPSQSSLWLGRRKRVWRFPVISRMLVIVCKVTKTCPTKTTLLITNKSLFFHPLKEGGEFTVFWHHFCGLFLRLKWRGGVDTQKLTKLKLEQRTYIVLKYRHRDC